MAQVEVLSITLPAELAELVRQRVASGDYASDSDVIREALQAWQEHGGADADRFAVIRAKIAEADADPRPSLTDEEVGRHFQKKIAPAA
jgi:antitoxin ParD1/3/4